MSTLTTALLATLAALAFATPILAQNFNGFGVPSYVTDGASQATQHKPVMLKAHKATKRRVTVK